MHPIANADCSRSGSPAEPSVTRHAILATATAAPVSTSTAAGDGINRDLKKQEGK